MALSLQGTPASLFNRLGKLGLMIKQSRSYQTSQQTNMVDTTNGAVATLTSEPDVQALIGGGYLSTLTGPESACSLARQVAAAVVNRMVFRDNPQLNQTLTAFNTSTSLREIVRQMKAQAQTVLAATVGGTPVVVASQPGPHFTGIGNGCVVVSVKRPLDGLTLENAFAETLLFTVSSDSYTGGQLAGNEPVTVTGTGSQGDVFAFNWPLGSNASLGVNAIDGSVSNGSGNLLTNSGFDSWSGGVPSNWVVSTGGSLITQENTLTFDAGSALKLTGDGATKPSWSQQFNASTTGTGGALEPLAQYSFAVWLRRDGVAAGAGTLVVELVDQNGNLIADQAGTNNQFTFDLTSLTASYAPYTGVFRTPNIMPTSHYIRIREGTALTNGRSVYLDLAGLGLMNQTVIQGPFVSVHSGSVPFQARDYAQATVANSRGAAGTLSTWQTVWYQLFTDAQAGELLLPSSATPSISDALIG